MSTQLDKEMDELILNVDALIQAKAQQYTPKVVGFLTKLNKLITRNINKCQNKQQK